MIGNLVQPKPNDTPTLMLQGFTETRVSSVKHLWPAGSHWQRLASPLPGDIKCGWTVSSADMRFYKHQVKQPLLCKPTNHPPPCVCLCSPNVMYSPARPLFTQIRQFVAPEKAGESGLSYVWPQDKRERSKLESTCKCFSVWPKCAKKVLDYTAATGSNTCNETHHQAID